MTIKTRRDYSIIGEPNLLAKKKGLVNAQWYMSPIPRKTMKELMKRKDGPAIRDTLIWLILLFSTGYTAYFLWGTWWAVPAFMLYGVIYYTRASSLNHECTHGATFKTSWMNEVLYHLVSFMILFQATPFRWSHTRHHTDTIIVGSDPEIPAPRPPVWKVLLSEIIHINFGIKKMKTLLLHSNGKLTPEEKTYIPESEYLKVYWEARVYVLLLIGIVVLCIYTGSILPAMFVLLPIFYGSWLVFLLAITQHTGLGEDVLDHRLNSRTFISNFAIRFLYSNMNYHIEHHMFPMVPYHALPALHEEIKADCPPASPSFRMALVETVTALWRQRKDPEYMPPRPLPGTANPYQFGTDFSKI